MASLLAAIAVYFAAGTFTGYTSQLRIRRKPQPDMSRLQQWLIQAGTDLDVRQFMAGCGAVGFVTLVVVTMVTGAWWLAIMPAAVAAVLPHAYYSRRRRERLRQLRRAWPDALRDALAAITAGSTLVMALYDLADRGPAPLRPAFARFRLVSRMMGVVPALELVKEELADPTSDRVLEVLVLAYQHGGGLVADVLRDLVAEMTDDLRLEAEIRTDGTEQRIESRVVVVLPWFLLLFLTLTSDQYQAYYRSAGGMVVVLGAVGWSLLGLVVMNRIGRTVPERRVLGGSSGVPGSGGSW